MRGLPDLVDLALSLIALAGAVGSWARWVRPRVKARSSERTAINEVLLGREAIPANPITGAPAQDAKPSIGQQVADQGAVLAQQAEAIAELGRLVTGVHHELHPNHGSSLKDQVTRIERRLKEGDRRFDAQATRLGRIETVLADELAVATDTVANAAEASRTALRVIDAALHAEPPPADVVDLD